jgi:LytS/YehU family sensor histidine kinase
LIKPLVENAIKHATSKIKQGELRLVIKEEEGALQVFIYDNGPAFPKNIVRGYGLQSTYDKLELLYPEKHRLAFINRPEKHIHIHLEKREHE